MKEAIVAPDELHHFIAQFFAACGVAEDQRESVARNMVWSETVGRANFGVIRVPIHVERIEKGVLNPHCRPVFEALSPSVGRLDADNGFGHFAGETGMAKAVEMAEKTGIGVVGVNNSNFFGTGAYFVDQAARQGMVALAMSNSFPKVAAHGGRKAVFGTNPFAFGAPTPDGQSLMVDFATSALAGSTVREFQAKGELLPEGLAVFADGEPARDPGKIGEAALLPFGGAKGYGLALTVEILAGVLTGAGFSHGVKSTYGNLDEKSDSGHFLVAIDIRRWMPLEQFNARMEDLIATVKESNPDVEILLPGEIRWRNRAAALNRGIAIPAPQKAQLETLAAKYGVRPPWTPAPAGSAAANEAAGS